MFSLGLCTPKRVTEPITCVLKAVQNEAGGERAYFVVQKKWTRCRVLFYPTSNSVINFREEVDYNLNKVEIEVEMEGGLGGRRESSSTQEVIIIIERSNSVYTRLPH